MDFIREIITFGMVFDWLLGGKVKKENINQIKIMKKVLVLLLCCFMTVVAQAQTDGSDVVDVRIPRMVEIIPNPATNSFAIYNIEGEANVSLYSVNGKEVLAKVVVEGEPVIISHLPHGIYLAKVNDEVYKVIKKYIILKSPVYKFCKPDFFYWTLFLCINL